MRGRLRRMLRSWTDPNRDVTVGTIVTPTMVSCGRRPRSSRRACDSLDRSRQEPARRPSRTRSPADRATHSSTPPPTPPQPDRRLAPASPIEPELHHNPSWPATDRRASQPPAPDGRQTLAGYHRTPDPGVDHVGELVATLRPDFDRPPVPQQHGSARQDPDLVGERQAQTCRSPGGLRDQMPRNRFRGRNPPGGQQIQAPPGRRGGPAVQPAAPGPATVLVGVGGAASRAESGPQRHRTPGGCGSASVRPAPPRPPGHTTSPRARSVNARR